MFDILFKVVPVGMALAAVLILTAIAIHDWFNPCEQCFNPLGTFLGLR